MTQTVQTITNYDKISHPITTHSTTYDTNHTQYDKRHTQDDTNHSQDDANHTQYDKQTIHKMQKQT